MITLEDIQAAQRRIEGVVYHTPLIQTRQTDSSVWFKPENFQPIGSFKIRGAYNRMVSLSREERDAGVIAYSSGNHAQGVAYAAQRLGIHAVIVMPSNAPPVKIAATRSYGAEVVIYDAVTESREEVAAKLMQGKNWTLIPPFADPFVMAGQGTIGLEIVEDLPQIELVLTPIGGGGLLGGVATAIKSLKPNAKVIGVEPEVAADAQASFKSGKVVEISAEQASSTIADGVRTLHISDLTLAQMQRYVDDVITVSESQLRDAAREIILRHKLVIEPTSALPYAAWLYHRDQLPAAQYVVCVLTGGNIEPSMLAELVHG